MASPPIPEDLTFDRRLVARLVDVYENAGHVGAMPMGLLPRTRLLLSASTTDDYDILLEMPRPFSLYFTIGPVIPKDGTDPHVATLQELKGAIWQTLKTTEGSFTGTSWSSYITHLERLVRIQEAADKADGQILRALRTILSDYGVTRVAPYNVLTSLETASGSKSVYHVGTDNFAVALAMAKAFQAPRTCYVPGVTNATIMLQTMLPLGDGERYTAAPTEDCLHMFLLGQLPRWASDRAYVGQFRTWSSVTWKDRRPFCVIAVPIKLHPYDNSDAAAELIKSIKPKFPKTERHIMGDQMSKWIHSITRGYATTDVAQEITFVSGDATVDHLHEEAQCAGQPGCHRPWLIAFRQGDGPTETAILEHVSGKGAPVLSYKLSNISTPLGVALTKKRPPPIVRAPPPPPKRPKTIEQFFQRKQ